MALPQTNLGLLGVLRLLFRLPFAVVTFLSILVRGLPLAIRRGIPMRLWLLSAQYRVALDFLEPREIQYLTAPTRRIFSQWVAKQRAKVSRLGNNVGRALGRLGGDVEPLTEPGANILWLGDRSKATKVVLFFHGGGFVAPAGMGHFTWCWNCYVDGGPGGARDDEVAVAVLEYTLYPEAAYPTHLRQAVAALNHLLRSGIAPGDLVIGGDSAGGNLTCQLLSHMLHPHPDVETVRLSGPLAGMFMVSPLLTARTDTASFRDNRHVDMLTAAVISKTNGFIFPADIAEQHRSRASNQNQQHQPLPLDGDLEWFGEIRAVSKSLYITAGAQELFRDDVRAFAEAVRRRNPGLDLTLDVAANEVHDAILLEGELNLVGDATKRMRKWASKCLA
ncbi:hypothetical protein CTA2_3377 [Colletotrichum tanaceti]|uniref:Alpha/beta hydrolase fold-3 domain-containing protein n=1 Tax=Colletotrichum tanaceti TaxID=1306861 RepID=A0A4U6XCV7_9PEZI|nr:hypothetical protein CTA2_3377 [Colletotrichum tanaceti]TKW53590.1 hypothetical protein CTA1_9746 [Colletotrichum tanaceti]